MSADKDDEAAIFAQVDADLDINPKIRAAGNLGRQVFEFVLRRNARRGFKGHIPLSHIGPDYLVEQLMLASRDDAVTGVTKAVTAKLIEIDEAAGTVRIVGWHASWGKQAKPGKDRTREWRGRKRAEQQNPVTHGDECDDEPSRVVTGDESDAKRREEKRDLDTHTRVRERPAGAGLIARNVWGHGVKAANALIAAKIRVVAWPIMPDASHSAWTALLDRVCELLVTEPSAEAAEAVAMNRVDVAAAKAKAEPNDAQWFTPNAMFTRNSFDTWARLDPAQFARKPAKKRAEGAAIGAASPRSDHPDNPTPVSFSEFNR